MINLNYTPEVSYKEKFYLNFEVINPDESPVLEVQVNLVHPYLSNKWNLKSFRTRYAIKVNGKSKDLEMGNNNFSVQIKYKDIFGKNYSYSKDINIKLKKLNFIQRIPLWTRDFLGWIDNLF